MIGAREVGMTPTSRAPSRWPARGRASTASANAGSRCCCSFRRSSSSALFVLPPILAVFGMATFRIELLREGTNRFVGLDNFNRMFADFDFLAAIPRTILFAAGSTLVTVPLAVSAALLMNRRSRFETLSALRCSCRGRSRRS